MLEFRLLGPVDASVDGHRYDLGPARQRCVAAALLVDANQVVSLDQLADRVWAGHRPQRSQAALYTYLSRLRRRLSDIDGVAVRRCSTGYLLAVDPAAVDMHRFRGLVTRAHATDDDVRALRLLDEALGLWRGDAFAHLDTPWLNSLRDALAGQRLAAELHRGDIVLRRGGHATLLAELTGRAAEHPLDERIAGQLMLALYRCGRQADALAQYLQLRARLAEALGVDPGPELQRLHLRILNSDPALMAPLAAAPATPVASATAPARPAAAPWASGVDLASGVGLASGVDLASSPAPCHLPPAVADFTGRARAVAQMEAAATGPSDGLRIIAVCGPAGVGKSSLALHVAHRLRRAFPDGQLHLDLRGTWPDAVAPFAALGRLLRALGLPDPAHGASTEERTSQFRDLIGPRRMLVVLDDARSAAQVRPLLPGTASCAAIITGRQRLTGLAGAAHLVLDTLAPQEAHSLLHRIVGAGRAAAEPAAVAEIARQCGYLPLAVRIAGARLAVRPKLRLGQLAARLGDELARLDELATEDLQVRASFGLSYHPLPEPARRLLRLLGLLDVPDLPAWVGAAMLDVTPHRAEELLELLVDACLLEVAEDGAGPARYRMHDLVRLFARERAAQEDDDTARRSALERAFGAWLALAEAADARLPFHSVAPIQGPARRWHPHPPAAAPAIEDPTGWFEAERVALAAAVWQAASLGMAELAWNLASAVQGFYEQQGIHDDARSTHQAALQACRRSGDRYGEAVLLRNLAALWTSRPGADLQDKLDAAEAALRIFTEVGEARGMVDAGWLCADVHRICGRHTQAAPLLSEALAVSAGAGYGLGECQTLAQLAIICWEQGRLDDARQVAERCLALARRLGARRDESVALTLLGLAQREHGQAALRQALAIAREAGDHVQETYTLARLGLLYTTLGHDSARVTLDLALARSRADSLTFGEALARWGLGELALAEDRPRTAVASLRRATRLLEGLRFIHVRAQVLTVLGRAHVGCDDPEAATAAWSAAHALFSQIDNHAAARHVTDLLATLR